MGCLDDADAIALTCGQLDETRRETALVHLADCDACRLLVAAAAANTASRESMSALEEVEPALPHAIGRFAVTGVAGHGAMGIVYRGHDDRLDRPVAIKLIRPELLGSDAQVRLEREARALAKIRHPGVVGVYEVGGSEDALFLAMEFVEGATLETWLRTEPRESAAILARFCEAGEGLLAAHQAGLVHRDFKPANAMVDADGHVRVTDFGLVSDGAVELERDRGSGPIEQLALTQTGAVMGTPAYMAPEQLAAQSVGPRADQFSFCVALFEALAGHRPFEATTYAGLLEAVRSNRPSPPRRPIPRRIHRALLRGLAAQPDDRFPSMRELLDQLAPRWGARWPWLIGAVVLSGLVALTLTRGFGKSADTPSTPESGTASAGAGQAEAEVEAADPSEASQAGVESPCDPLSARWDSVWSEDARKHIRAVVQATWPEQPPPGTAQRVVDAWAGLGRVKATMALDSVNRLGDEWRAEVADTCANVERQDAFAAKARRQCLDDALTRLEALIEAPPSDARFVDVLEPVRRHVRRCTTQLVSKLSMPAEEVAELAAEARVKLARASAARLDGRAGEAKALADAALALGQDVGDAPLFAEIWLERGLALAQLGPEQAEAAAESLHEAVAYAQQDAYHRVLREASDALAWHYAFALDDPRQAERWLESAARLDDRVEPTQVELRQRRLIEAHLARRRGDDDDAGQLLDGLLDEELDASLLRVAVDESVALLGDDEGAIAELYARLELGYRLDPAGLEVLARARQKPRSK